MNNLIYVGEDACGYWGEGQGGAAVTEDLGAVPQPLPHRRAAERYDLAVCEIRRKRTLQPAPTSSLFYGKDQIRALTALGTQDPGEENLS